jgi:hypothetical protein
MKDQMQDRLNTFKIQDLVTQRKAAAADLLAKQDIKRTIASAFRPAVQGTPATFYGQESNFPMRDDEGNLMPGATEATIARPAYTDWASITPKLMETTQGMDYLTKVSAAQKAMRPEAFNLGKDEVRFVVDQSGNTIEVARGVPKPEPTPSAIAEYNFAKTQGYKGSYLDFEIAKRKAGAPSTVVYPPGALVPTKETVNDTQAALMKTNARLSTYNQIEAGFNPRYLQPSFRATQLWASTKDKAGVPLSPEATSELAKFSEFKQNSINNITQTIKDTTGNAMGIGEAERIMAGLPSAGTGLFDGDSPVEFDAKLKNTMKQLRMVEARNVYVLRKGLSFKDIPLSNMPEIMNQRGAQLAEQYKIDSKNPTPAQLNAIKRQLAVEFGISAD